MCKAVVPVVPVVPELVEGVEGVEGACGYVTPNFVSGSFFFKYPVLNFSHGKR